MQKSLRYQLKFVCKFFYAYGVTVKPVCNDQLYNKIYFLWFIQ